MSSPLTQFLNKGYANSSNIWEDVFEMNWEDNVQMTRPWTLKRIKTSGMYYRCKEFLDKKDNEPKLIDMNDILIAAMENLWFDELKDYLQYPVALATAAAYYNNLTLLKHLVKDHGIDVKKSLEHLVLIHDGKYSRGYGEYALDMAAKWGHFEILKCLHDAGNHTCSLEAMNYAAIDGHFNIA
ncbi:hypothetical protein THRCLA_08920 [Thraustotheca clavata]|uniref:Ankyrin repeat n=1 Tax=Thraustotheca clavata TaxID=74557 RepID=A0A1V9Z117_9STRA|nr:hypothetical protein THRCLA_08920 [Thraustotheca clavata]